MQVAALLLGKPGSKAKIIVTRPSNTSTSGTERFTEYATRKYAFCISRARHCGIARGSRWRESGGSFWEV